MARVPTGMKAGVSTAPCAVVRVPRRAREWTSRARTCEGQSHSWWGLYSLPLPPLNALAQIPLAQLASRPSLVFSLVWAGAWRASRVVGAGSHFVAVLTVRCSSMQWDAGPPVRTQFDKASRQHQGPYLPPAYPSSRTN